MADAEERDGVGKNGASTARVLVLARSYPNPVFPQLGLWTQRLVQTTALFAEVKVIAPVPYAPPLPRVGRLAYYARFREVEPTHWDDGVEVLHPRLLTGPGYSTHSLEGGAYGLAALRAARTLRSRFQFDLVHSHFVYPDGVAGALLGRRYRVPVVITDHSRWLPWLQEYPIVRRQALWAARSCADHIATTEYLRGTIAEVTGDASRVAVIPYPVDPDVFRPSGGERAEEQILFVGATRYVKGVDVLLHAFAQVRRHLPRARLVLAGEPFYRSYQLEAARLMGLVSELGLDDAVESVGGKEPAEVAELMAESAVLVLPSRAEALGMVLVEALACGTPVVATRSGGPEEVVAPGVGELVPPEDPTALAEALIRVLEHPDRYDRDELRRYALGRYGAKVVGERLAARYRAVLDAGRGASAGSA